MAWPTFDCRLSNEVLSVWAAWWLEGRLLRPLLGRELERRAGGVWSTSTRGGHLRSARRLAQDRPRPGQAPAGSRGPSGGAAVEVEVFGAFTRALREADVQRADDYLSTRPGEKQGIIPDLLFGEADFLELKGIRSDGRHSNYNGAAVTGVEKRAAAWLVELRNKVVRLDERVFGVQQPAVGPFQRRLQEIGGSSRWSSVNTASFGQPRAHRHLAIKGVTKRQIATCWTSGRVLPQCRSGSSGSA